MHNGGLNESELSAREAKKKTARRGQGGHGGGEDGENILPPPADR